MNALNRLATFQVLEIDEHPTYLTEVREWVPLVALPGSPLVGEKFWVSVRPMGRAEVIRMGIEAAVDRRVLRMRYRSDITPSMRVVLHGDADEILQIVGAPMQVGDRKEWLDIAVEAWDPAGGNDGAASSG